jgi:glycosyltransferase involved in cell wall biosynthesis
MKTIITFTYKSTFVKTDIDILKSIENNSVKEYHFNNRKSLILLSFIKQFIYLLFNPFDVYFCWFNDYHSFLPVLFSRLYRAKSIIVIGGYDATVVPSIKYGTYYKKGIRTTISDINYYFAHYLCPVHSSLYYSYNDYIQQEQGFADKKRTGKVMTIPIGYDVDFWRSFECTKFYDFIMVGICNDEKTFKRKGFDMFIELAKRLPEKKFIAIGVNKKYHSLFPENVRVTGKVDKLILRLLYNSSKFILQLSLTEGLPLTLREGILCGCIPIVSNVPSMADIVKPENILYNRYIDELIKLCSNTPKYNPEIELNVRTFTFEKRTNELKKLIYENKV